MSLDEAMAMQSLWIRVWVQILFLMAFVVPWILLFWRQTRLDAVLIIVSSVVSAITIMALYDALGFVRLLGLGHFCWIPLLLWLSVRMRNRNLPMWPKRILLTIMAVLSVSLIFDIVDVTRYALGDRGSMLGA